MANDEPGTPRRRRVDGRRLTLLATFLLLGGATTLVVYSPTLYRMFCAATGYAGTVRQAADATTLATDIPVAVRFDSNVAPGLDWEFHAETSRVDTHIGEPTQVYFVAHNLSDHTTVGHATFNIMPAKAAQYFFKVQCFCFTDERLEPGETARMPVLFYVDPAIEQDALAREVREITLSYTFFGQTGLTPEQVAKARDLSDGSRREEAVQRAGGTVEFNQEGVRR